MTSGLCLAALSDTIKAPQHQDLQTMTDKRIYQPGELILFGGGEYQDSWVEGLYTVERELDMDAVGELYAQVPTWPEAPGTTIKRPLVFQAYTPHGDPASLGFIDFLANQGYIERVAVTTLEVGAYGNAAGQRQVRTNVRHDGIADGLGLDPRTMSDGFKP